MKLTTESTVVNDQKINTDIGTAQTTADDAKTIATDTAQYFWFASSGTDTGAHISEQTRADFEANPSGGNLLARSNGIAVRDGLTELGIYSADEIRVGKAQGQRVSLTSTDMKMYDSGGNQRIRVNSGEGVTVGRPDKGRAVITDQGMTIYDVNNDDVAYYGSGARIGKSGDYHVNISTSGVSFMKNNDLFGSFESATNIGGLLYLLSATSSSVYLQARPDRITLHGENNVVAQLTNNALIFNIGDNVNLIGIRSSDYSIGVEEDFYVGRSITAEEVIIANSYIQSGAYFNSSYTYNHPGGASSTTVQANTIYITSNGDFLKGSSMSSRKVKHDISLISDELLDPHRLYDIPVVQFVYNESYLGNKKDCRYLKLLPGFIAEDVNEIYPRAADISEEGEIVGWNDHYMIPPMLALIQEQHKELEQLKTEVNKLRGVM